MRKITKQKEIDQILSQATSYHEAFAIGVSAKRHGNNELALLMLQKACEISPTDFCMVALAATYRAIGEFKRGEKIYRDILNINPLNSAALVGLAAILKDVKNFNEGYQLSKKALQQNPDDCAALYCLGSICNEMNRIEEAEDYFLKAIKIGCESIGLTDNVISLRNSYKAKGNITAVEKLDRVLQTIRNNGGK